MKTCLTILLFTVSMLNAQIMQGTYTIGPAGNFTSIKEAANNLNTRGLSGDVILELSINYTDAAETFPITFNQFTSTGGTWQVVLHPAAGAVGLVTTATIDCAFILNGVDRLTIDGRPAGVGNTSQWTVKGNSLEAIELKNGATNNTITYLNLENNAQYSAILSISSTNSVGNSFNTISHCLFRENTTTNTTLSYAFISSLGSNSARNTDNSITDNLFQNIRNSGVNVGPTGIGDNWTIKRNSFYRSFATAAQETQSAISFTGGYYSNNNDISDNYIGGSAPLCGGTYWVNEGWGDFYGINVTAGTTTATKIQNNTISNIHISSLIEDAPVVLLKAGEGSYVITNNVIGNPLTLQSIKCDSKSNIVGLMIITTGNSEFLASVECSGNIISNITQTNNERGVLTGVQLSADKSINLQRNKIFNLGGSGSTSDYAYVSGIQIWGKLDCIKTYTIANNMISLGKDISGNTEYYGIYNHSYTTNVIKIYYNSVLLSGVYSDNEIDAAYYHEAYSDLNSQTTLKNNILLNFRSNGCVIAVYKSVPSADITSNNNFLSSVNMATAVYQNNISSLNNWLALNHDRNSFYRTSLTINVDSLFTDYSHDDLFIKDYNQEAWYVNGKGTPIAGFTNDFNTDGVRSALPENGATTIGADEITAATLPFYATEINDPAPGDTSVYTVNNKNVAAVEWSVTGTVPDSLNLRYYSGRFAPGTTGRLRSNAYWEVSPAGGSGYQYSITLYYDEAALGNITSESNIVIAKSTDNGASWLNFLSTGTGTGQYQLDTANNSITVYGLSTFSIFTLSDADAPLPVELSSFTASLQNRTVVLKWETKSELNSFQFVIERTIDNKSWSIAGTVKAAGSSTNTINYSFTDNIISGKYGYRLKMVDNNGCSKYSNIVYAELNIPDGYLLDQNYPNPFNPSTTISFALPMQSVITLNVYNVMGEKVQEIFSGSKEEGFHSFSFNSDGIASGVYYYKLTVNNGPSLTKKMIIIK